MSGSKSSLKLSSQISDYKFELKRPGQMSGSKSGLKLSSQMSDCRSELRRPGQMSNSKYGPKGPGQMSILAPNRSIRIKCPVLSPI